MQIIGYPALDEHKRIHQYTLGKIGEFKNLALNGTDFAASAVAIREVFDSHILDHDKQFSEYLKGRTDLLQRS